MQFAKRGGFTQKIGSFVVSGHYRLSEEVPENPNEYLLEGPVYVLFGGIEFSMAKGNGGHSLFLTMNDEPIELLPERMLVSEDSVNFTFPGGTELIFAALRGGSSEELRITGIFPDNVSDIELPFKLQRRAGVQNTGDGQFIVNFGGANYSFGNSPMDLGRRLLLLSAGTLVSYRAIPEQKAFSPDDFILPEAEVAEAYNMAVTRWRDRNFPLWNTAISGQNNEDLVIALAGEALSRGVYRTTVNAIPPVFLQGSVKTYQSSAYLGGLDQAYRSLVAVEREKYTRLSRQISEKSLEFLLEPRVFEFFELRGYSALTDAGAALAAAVDPELLALDLLPGVLEGYTDWKTFRSGEDNPFENLADKACSVIFESLLITAGSNPGAPVNRVYVSNEGAVDPEFNLRLGKALLAYADSVQENSWAGIGRSLILSALYGTADESSVPGELRSARLYRLLAPLEAYPRAAALTPPGVWAWTTASALSLVEQNDVLDISVSFPVEETHYILIRGIRPFVRLQLYDMDFRSDLQFERYDSSGWSYISQEQTLLLKMRHRNPEEHIRIIFREETRPVVVPVPAPSPVVPVTPAAESIAPAGAVIGP